MSQQIAKRISLPSFTLPAALTSLVEQSIEDWQAHDKVQRLWQSDASLWTGADEADWLGWLNITEQQLAHRGQLQQAAQAAQREGFTDILLMGMGGSSLCPEVLEKTFGRIAGFPQLHVLESTDPAQIKRFDNAINPAKTLFVVSSKSGTTLEPNIFKQYFFERAKKARGAEKAGSHFIAITDPGSKMQQVAEGNHFRNVFFGVPGIGGRYSALSNFGMVPAALMGVDLTKFLERTEEMVEACRPSISVPENPGVLLGIVLGTAARNGRDKATIITSPGISDLGAWLEQLLAESTGKQGHGIIPVDREPLGPSGVYGSDRIFAYVRLDSAPDARQDAQVSALERAGHPVVRMSMADIYDLGQEFFRWEIATAVAGSIIGINAFDQPDVEASKVATRNLTAQYEKTGSLPEEKPFFEDAVTGMQLFTDSKNADALSKAAGNDETLTSYLRAHFNRLNPGDYFALLAYIEMNSEHEARLQEMRHVLRDTKRVATCLGFGPRFLHSTGQAYKGGPNSGVFLQVTCDDAADLPVPGQKYSFGIVKAAQARGDFQVLAERGRRTLRLHLGKDLTSSLSKLLAAFRQALN